MRIKFHDEERLFSSLMANISDFFNERSKFFRHSHRAKTVKEFFVRSGMRPLISERNAKRLAASMIREFWKEVENDVFERNATFQFPDGFMDIKLGEVDIDRPNSANYYFFDDYYITYEMGPQFRKVTKEESYLLFLSKRCKQKLNKYLRDGKSY